MNRNISVSDGSIVQYTVKDGVRYRWQFVVTERLADGGKVKVRKDGGGFRTRAEAIAAKQEATAAFKKYGLPDFTLPTENPTLEELAEEWLASLGKAASTVAGYRKNLRNHVLPYLGSYPVREVSVLDVQSLYRTLLEKGRKDSKAYGASLGANTVTKIHQNLRALLSYAKLHDYISANVAESPKLVVPSRTMIREEAEAVEVWTLDEMKKVLDWNEHVDRDSLSTLWRVFGTTAMRRGEAIAIQWKDIDFENGLLSIVRAADSANRGKTKSTKTYQNRVIDLTGETIDCLLKYREERSNLGPEFVLPNAWVFGTDDNRLRDPNDVTRRWSRVVKRAQKYFGQSFLPWVTIKGLRHSHATHLLQVGVQPKVVQERLGHSNIQTTLNIYSHVLPTIQKRAIGQFEKAWNGVSE